MLRSGGVIQNLPGLSRVEVRLPDGTQAVAEYTIAIDWTRMRKLVERASHNKGKRATAGPITVRVIAIHKGGFQC